MLETVDDVIDAVGGTAAAASLAGVTMPAVSNWRSRRFIPSEKFMIFAEALGRVGKQAPPNLFTFDEPAEART